jgi:hypothetical protein
MDKNNTNLKAKSVEKDMPNSGPLDLAKTAEMTADSKEGRRLKFMPKGSSSKVTLILAGSGILFIVGLLLILMLGGGESGQRSVNNLNNEPVEQKNLEENNNSEGYLQTPPANFENYSLSLNYDQPELFKSEKVEVGFLKQANLQDGFSVFAVGVNRDYRPASEFTYKRIAESGDELVRVNLIVGNAKNSNVPIGYRDLGFYAIDTKGARKEAERISEDIYSPKDGQILGGKQSQKVSLHYRIKRGESFFLEKSRSYQQKGAREKEGQEKNPVLYLKINLD